MTGGRTARADHRLLEYGSDADFVDGVLRFLAEGRESAEPGLVVVSARHLAMLRARIDPDDTLRIRFADSAEWGSGNIPARVLAIESAIRKMIAAGSRCRFVGEFTLPGAVQRREWGRHEAAANLLHVSVPLSMLCAVDTRSAPAEYLGSLHQTHPIIAPDRLNPDFVEPWSYLARLDGAADAPAPPQAETTTVLGELDLHPMRARVSEQARGAGLGQYQIQAMALALTEIVANALHHAGTLATIKTWTEQSRFCCEVRDKGPGITDPLAGYQPPVPAGGRCGLWLARTFSDELLIATSNAGTAVRICYRR